MPNRRAQGGPSGRRPETLRAKRARRDRAWGSVLIFFALILLVGVTTAYVIITKNQVKLDPQSECPINGPTGVTAVLFDRTDLINRTQSLFLKNRLARLLDAVPRFGEVDTYSLDARQGSAITPLLQLCNPGKGSDTSAFYGNPVQAERRWKRQFEEPLRSMMDEMRKGGDAQQSPIFEAIQSISLQSFQSPRMQKATKQLVVISDLLQFTKQINLYRGALDYDQFRNSAEAGRLRTNLSNVAVEVLFISRTDPARIRPLIQFWADWFLEQGASRDNLRFVSVEG